MDVTISSTSLSRVFRPCLLLRLTLSPPDARLLTMECSVDKFHKLRYEVARAIKLLHETEQQPVMQHGD